MLIMKQPQNKMNTQILTMIQHLVKGMMDGDGCDTLKNIEDITGLTFERWCMVVFWSNTMIEATINSLPLSKAAVLAHSWAEAHKAPQELAGALECLKKAILQEDEEYIKRIEEFLQSQTYARNELRQHAPHGFKSEF